jgi:hypothetical protein
LTNPNFEQFLELLPSVELPLTISDELQQEVSKLSTPVSESMLQEFIKKYEPIDEDDLTEYIPCFRVNISDQFVSVVYWRASLLQYFYILANYSPKGEMIDKKVIAGTTVINGKVEKSACIINEEWEIFRANGSADNGFDYNADATKFDQYEILENGRIE